MPAGKELRKATFFGKPIDVHEKHSGVNLRLVEDVVNSSADQIASKLKHLGLSSHGIKEKLVSIVSGELAKKQIDSPIMLALADGENRIPLMVSLSSREIGVEWLPALHGITALENYSSPEMAKLDVYHKLKRILVEGFRSESKLDNVEVARTHPFTSYTDHVSELKETEGDHYALEVLYPVKERHHGGACDKCVARATVNYQHPSPPLSLSC